jgi:hypothetical protein
MSNLSYLNDKYLDLKDRENGKGWHTRLRLQSKASNIRQNIIIALALAFVMIVVLGFVVSVFGEEVNPPAKLWQGLIGEAVSEGYNGMYAVACVYRNRLERDMNLGCVALKRKDLANFVKRQGSLYENMAKEIVRKVFGNPWLDVTGGATHYEHTRVYGTPYWAKGMKIVKVMHPNTKRELTLYKQLSKKK